MSLDKSTHSAPRKALPMRPFSESLPMALLRAREAAMRLFRPGLRKRGVTEQQWRILRALAHTGPMEITDLAEATFLLAPSLSRILPDLERRGFVSRKQVDSDLRRSVISLEPQGLRVIASHAPYSGEIYAQILERFGERRLAQLSELLRELEATLQALSLEQEPTTKRNHRKALER
jgi:homoprotocatechuate degradation regulator HpaR